MPPTLHHPQSACTGSPTRDQTPAPRPVAAPQRPPSVGTRARYVLMRTARGSTTFELRAHNGSVLLSCEDDADTPAQALAVLERLRTLMSTGPEAVDCRQSLTGKWYFVILDGERILARSRPFDYRSRMDKALYATRACAPGSRVSHEP